ncbi:MAG TPA: hypothetical protein VFH27_03845 [Longimicrobiaceae bacterium]|nr:hypothetical protein [Longimicrobiaceae bacterium]
MEADKPRLCTWRGGGGTDEPQGSIRSDSFRIFDPILIVPSTNWRGAYERSTFAEGTLTSEISGPSMSFQQTTGSSFLG